MIRILIADDHIIVRHGLKLILEKSGEMKVVAEHGDGTSAINWLLRNDCDVALIDIAMPGMNGVDLLKHLRRDRPRLPVLILSSYPEAQFAVRLIKAGAAGYLNKECAPDEVVSAVHCVLNGKKHISPAVVELIANEVGIPDGKLPHETLSNREYQIFLLIASGKPLAETAGILNLSVKTISTYRSRIMEKMSMRNNADMMRYAIENHLFNNM